jgi:hypothetical protein
MRTFFVEEGKKLKWLEVVSYSFAIDPRLGRVRTFSFDFSLICVVFTAGDAVWPATFLLRSSSACASAPVVRAVAILVQKARMYSQLG